LFAVLPAVDEVAWAPDSSRFVALLPPTDENSTGTLALFDRDGGLLAVVSQGTGETRIVLNADSWSPDGRYFTFGVYFGDEYHPILHLVDTQEQHSINTCVHGVGPVWHPDSGLITYLSYDLEYLTPPEEPCGICQEYEMLNLETWQRIVVAGATDPSLIGWRE